MAKVTAVSAAGFRPAQFAALLEEDDLWYTVSLAKDLSSSVSKIRSLMICMIITAFNE